MTTVRISTDNLSDTKLTQIVVTPYRVIDLLEDRTGDFVLRATEHGSRYAVAAIHLYRRELLKLGDVIDGIRGDQPSQVDFYFAKRGKIHGTECSACGEFFTDSRGRKGNDCIAKCMAHAKEKHQSERGNFRPKPEAVE